jgi:hypothetical protein
MANKLNGFLGDVLRGFLDPGGNVSDFQHAARLYVDDTLRLAPKNKFLYYVVFNINHDAMGDTTFKDRHKLELNYLVKSADLPKYTIETETLNQYNRKTNVYKKIIYDPVNLTLHDDNNGITNTLWALYYGYYFRDRLNSAGPNQGVSPQAYNKTTYLTKEAFPFRYGLDNDSYAPFFNSIQLFTLSRQRFFSYMLCNPKITKWEHDTVDQNDSNGVLENKMSLAYDAVIYSSGSVDVDEPAGFALLHYDNTPSPLANADITNGGIEGIFGDVFSINSFSNPNNFLRRRTATTYVNLGNQASFGLGAPSFYGTNYLQPSSGLLNYGFGVSPTVGLVTAGIGLAGAAINGVGNILNNVFNNSVSNNASINNSFAGTESPPGTDSSTTDAMKSSLPGGTSEDGLAPGLSESAKNAKGLVTSESGLDGDFGANEAQAADPDPLVENGYGPNAAQEMGDFSNNSSSPPDGAQELIANNPGGSGNAETDVGSPFG